MSAKRRGSYQTPWQLPFQHAFDVVNAHTRLDEAVAELLAISHHDRRAVAHAMANCSALLAVTPEDTLTHGALDVLDRTLHEGDDHNSWARVA